MSMHRVAALALFSSALVFAQSSKPLPKPRTEGGKPLMTALAERKSSRDFKAGAVLDAQTLSNLLWAAFGINRPDGKRTAATAHNWQDIDIYVVTASALCRWDAKANALEVIAAGDHRAAAGTQDFVKDASVNLVYVSDLAKFEKTSDQDRLVFAGAHAGAIAQNVYLFAASEGLATVVRASVDTAAFTKLAQLRPTQRVILAQSAGLPK